MYYDGHWLNGFTNGDATAGFRRVRHQARSGRHNVVYSTLLGGVNSDLAYHIAVDDSGAAYVTGWTISTNFPITVATNLIANYLTNNLKSLKTTNIFLTKITNSSGTSAGIAYSVAFGGSRSDVGYGVALDPAGDAFVTGYTTATNFPCTTTNNDGYLRATNSGDADVFVTAFNPDASAVLYSTLLGGSKNDYGYGIAVDPAGNAYVVGQTDSTNFTTTPGAFQTFRNGTNDTFMAKILLQSQPELAIAPAGGTNVTLAWSVFEPEFLLNPTPTWLPPTGWPCRQPRCPQMVR